MCHLHHMPHDEHKENTNIDNCIKNHIFQPGCSLGMGGWRMLQPLHIILCLSFACFLRDLCPFIIILLLLYNILHAATLILNENPDYLMSFSNALSSVEGPMVETSASSSLY